MKDKSTKQIKEKKVKSALLFITLMGVISLFSDMTHEGARSVLGDFLSITGGSAAAIGFVSGLGELLGYSLRIFSGMIADKTGKYWTLIIVGYVIQVLAIPLLSLVPENGYMWAFALVITERVAKAVKKPAKNTLVSFASGEIGEGKGFAYQEFLDQLGAFLGPVILFIIGIKNVDKGVFNTYRLSFLALGIPALITIVLVIMARIKYPSPEEFRKEEKSEAASFNFKSSFVYYMIAICLFAFGFADFTLITLRAVALNVIPRECISLLYALSMAVDAFAALIFGFLYDKIGLKALIISTGLSLFFAPLIFVGNSLLTLIIGVVLWGIGMGAEESIMKAAVSSIVPPAMRSTGFGIFETGFGVFWFLGSSLLGILYDYNLVLLAIVSVISALLSIIFYVLCIKRGGREKAKL